MGGIKCCNSAVKINNVGEDGGIARDEIAQVEVDDCRQIIFNEVACPCQHRVMEGVDGVVQYLYVGKEMYHGHRLLY